MKGKIFAACLVLLASSCSKAPSAPPASEPPPPPPTAPIEQIEELRSMVLIRDLYTDKSRYNPGDTPVLTVELSDADIGLFTVGVKVRHVFAEVFSTDVETTAAEGTVDIPLTLPEDDFTGYSVEVTCRAGKELLDYGMTAVDVSSDWNVFPRYGYLTKMKARTEDDSRRVLDRLRKHHITGLFYYDVIDAHDKPLAGTVDNPAESWNTLNHAPASRQTVIDLIRIGHEYNMASFLYNLIFGAYDDYRQKGVSAEWGLYKDPRHEKQDNHDLSSLGWESKRLWVFDPGNTQWQDYYVKVHADVLNAFGYDGIQVDSLGNRGVLFDYDGNPVKLNERYTSLLSRLKEELNTRVLFNAVSGYGMSEQLTASYPDILYMEIWPGDGSSYTKLKTETDRIYKATGGERGTVLAAYMNYGKNGKTFNRPGVNLTNAVLLAAGGSHLELGDTGMLSSEYYPGESLLIPETLAGDLRGYYSFMTAYENLLRGPGLTDGKNSVYIGGNLASVIADKDRVWSFSKEKEDGTGIYHLINLTGVEHTDWADTDSTQTEPSPLKNQITRIYAAKTPRTVGVASPDWRSGLLTEVPFTCGADEKGAYIEFTLPSLTYWTMVVTK
ncbi:MAG: glycoside hydrolase family 66 protein [Oscillospiraceae bacterium]|jgi:dextranase|nr:glycoside hydrolase family 66 protein [Oscillospiraceae bacterium]